MSFDKDFAVFVPYETRKAYALKPVWAAIKREFPHALLRPVRLDENAPALPGALRADISKPIGDNAAHSRYAALIREFCRLEFLKTDKPWLVFIDSDCEVGEGFGKLCPSEPMIQTSLYAARRRENTLLGFVLDKRGFTHMLSRAELLARAGGTMRAQVDWTGFGATYVPREAAERISWEGYDLSDIKHELGEDGYFCTHAAKLGIPTVVDWSVPIKHYQDAEWYTVIDKELRGMAGKKETKVPVVIGVRFVGKDKLDLPHEGSFEPGLFYGMADAKRRKRLIATGLFVEETKEVNKNG